MEIPVLSYPVACSLSGLPWNADKDLLQHVQNRPNVLWSALESFGAALLELDASSAEVLGKALQDATAFHTSPISTKKAYSSFVPGEGFQELPGKDLLAFRVGLAEPTKQLQHFEVACCMLNQLGAEVLSDVCRSDAVDSHPAELHKYLEDIPQLRRRPSVSVLRASKYTHPGAPYPQSQSLAYLPHVDRGVLTLVASEDRQGLQMWLPGPHRHTGDANANSHANGNNGGGNPGGGSWVGLPLGPGRVGVLVGHSLSFAVGGMLTPVTHRVDPASAAGPGGAGRLSLAYELCFRPGALVDPESVLRQAPGRPRSVGPPQYVSDLMRQFSRDRPLSVNGVHTWAAAGAAQAEAAQAPVPGATPAPPAEAQAKRAAGRKAVRGAAARQEAQPVANGGRVTRRSAAAAAAAAAAAGSPADAGSAAAVGPGSVRAVAAAGGQAAAAGPGAGVELAWGRRRGRGQGAGRRRGTQEDDEGAAAKAPRLGGLDAGEPGGCGARAGPDTDGDVAAMAAEAQPALADLGSPAPAGGELEEARQGPQAAEENDKTLRVGVRGMDKHEMQFIVRRSTKLGHVFSAYAAKKAVPRESLFYMFDGCRVWDSATAAEIGLEDGEIIDVFVEQVGN